MEDITHPARAASPAGHTGFVRLERDLERVRAAMVETTAITPGDIERPFTQYVKHPGRMFRPVLTLVSAYMFGAPSSELEEELLVKAGAGVELLHLATLCHDDICDNALTRRGHPTVSAAFGDDAALVSGDYLLACATSVFATLGERQMRVAGDTVQEICRGQMREMLDAYDLERTEEAYLSAISGKTAALMAACARVGAALGGASDADQETMAAFGHSLGVAFQIWDDVMDIWAPPGITGKPPGKDIENGIFTLPVIYALREDRDELPRLLERRPSSQEHRDDVVRVLEQLRVRERTVEVARGHVTDALASARHVDCPGDAAASLVDVARRLMPEVGHLLPGQPQDEGRQSRESR